MMEKLSEKRKLELQLFAETIRLNTLRQFKTLGFGHVGGAMSIVETLAVLYGQVMRIDPRQPDWPERDWLVMSKGHAGPALYAALALKGYFPLAMLETLNKAGTSLPSHCDRNLTSGVDMTTGSLGQGMSTAIGVALGHRLDERDNHTFLILGDGECDEGQVWEGALSAAHFRVDRLSPSSTATNSNWTAIPKIFWISGTSGPSSPNSAGSSKASTEPMWGRSTKPS